MEKMILSCAKEIDSICEYRYNQFVKKNDVLCLHSHDYYELIFLYNTPQKHYINGAVFDLPVHTLLFVRPNDYHDLYNENNNNAIIQHIAFTKEMAESLFRFLTPQFPSKRLITEPFSPYVILDTVQTKYLQSIFNSLNTIDFEDKTSKNINMRASLSQIFSKFFFLSDKSSQTENIPLWLSNACSAMNSLKNFSEGTSKMTEISGKTREHLCRCMKKYYGMTPSEYINDIRLTYIANRLANSDIKIIDLCFESGFSNLGWMYKLFQKKYGVSPAEFRKKMS